MVFAFYKKRIWILIKGNIESKNEKFQKAEAKILKTVEYTQVHKKDKLKSMNE